MARAEIRTGRRTTRGIQTNQMGRVLQKGKKSDVFQITKVFFLQQNPGRVVPTFIGLSTTPVVAGRVRTAWKHANIVPVLKTKQKLASSATIVRNLYNPLWQRSLRNLSTLEPSVLSNHYFNLNNMDFAQEDPASASFLLLYTILAKH